MQKAEEANIDFVTYKGLDLRVAFDRRLVSPHIEASISQGSYELDEIRAAAQTIGKHDRVLEVGGGLGVLAAYVWNTCQPSSYVTFEANPEIRHLLQLTLEINHATGVQVRGEILTDDKNRIIKGSAEFFLSQDFWFCSSIENKYSSSSRLIPTTSFTKFLKIYRPSTIICDIEGGELDLFGSLNPRPSWLRRILGAQLLQGVHAIILELHPYAIGKKGASHVCNTLQAMGFCWVEVGKHIYVFKR